MNITYTHIIITRGGRVAPAALSTTPTARTTAPKTLLLLLLFHLVGRDGTRAPRVESTIHAETKQTSNEN